MCEQLLEDKALAFLCDWHLNFSYFVKLDNFHKKPSVCLVYDSFM